MGRVECALLGPLSITVDGEPAVLGGPKQRLLLAKLLTRANSVVGVHELIDVLWAEDPPRTARKNVQVYVSGLRKIFGERLAHVGCGYRLRLDADECDVLRFERLSATGRRALRDGDPHTAVAAFERGIELWRERPLAEFAAEPALSAEIERLTEQFLTMLEDWAELELDRDGHRRVLDRLDDFARRYPVRQRLAAAWMRALAAGGRVAEALGHYEIVRRELACDLGIDPGRTLADLHDRLLRGEEVGTRRGGVVFHQIGRDLPDFVGRAAQIHRLVDEFVGERGADVAVVSGPVGIGKTAFAVHAAHLLRDSFPAGLIMTELTGEDGRPRSIAEVLAELMDLAGLSAEPGTGLPRALATWRAWLAEHRLLLVLDGAGQESVLRALLPGAGGSRVIVTGHGRLSGLESVLRLELPALSEVEQMELLARIIGWDRILAERAAAEEILSGCEGLPLAIRITGAKLSAMRHVRLGDFRCRSLADLTAGELSVRARYERFYRGLTGEQRDGYRRLMSLPAPPFSHGDIMSTLDYRTVEALVECALLSVPECAVSAQSAAYGMSRFAYRFGQEQRVLLRRIA